ncbi:hypothetical protein HCN44_004267 [Aphidius gifuensis]|uniref:Phospholipase B1, membrane-associated n=2 Tax=Aphidius gifuensis TaxID=684658 RepID=A0A834XZA8_APHGI|nr:hypothetical protein HCN44_004267 [Aphidius gifuensis]
MNIINFYVYFVIYSFPNIIFGQRTSLDSIENIKILRAVKDFTLSFLGSTGKKESREYKDGVDKSRVQEQIPENINFPCNVTDGRSKIVPTSVNRLRPGDIDIVGALGDSLTAGFGVFSTSIFNIFIENRGVSFPIGGQDTWRNVLTLPNILKEFNPNLYGFSLGDSYSHHEKTKFNIAEVGAMSRDLPFMAKLIVRKMKNDPKVNIKQHWKHINIFIGSNDFCSEICWVKNPWQVLKNHKIEMIETLRILRDNLPRTIVSIIPSPNLKVLVEMKGRSKICEMTVSMECSCLIGLTWRKQRNEFYNLMTRWQEFDEQVANFDEFHRDDFAVIAQPLSTNVKYPTLSNGMTDFRYLSSDCFHFSQIANARTAISLWRNMLEPTNNKSRLWTDEGPFPCPTEKRPYIATPQNSIKFQ